MRPHFSRTQKFNHLLNTLFKNFNKKSFVIFLNFKNPQRSFGTNPPKKTHEKVADLRLLECIVIKSSYVAESQCSSVRGTRTSL